MKAPKKDPGSSRAVALVADLASIAGLFSLFGYLFFPSQRWVALTHLGIPLGIYPLYSYVCATFFGGTPAQLLLGLRRTGSDGRPPQRFYDWLFQSRLRLSSTRRSAAMHFVLIVGSTGFLAWASSLLWFRDPTLRPFDTRTVTLFAPDPRDRVDWDVLPYFYATGAFPKPSHPIFRKKAGLEYSVPYERGPPNRFLGKILVYWRELDSRMILSGPTTAAAPSTQGELKACLSKWFGCVGARRKIWKASIGSYFEDRKLVVNQWFEVENEFLTPEERPRGIYVRSQPDKGRIREGYFVVGPKMAIQGFVLDTPDREEGRAASDILEKIIGSLRVSGDLMAPRAFVNPRLASVRVGPQSSVVDLIGAESVLLAKVSIEPKEAESFYHLAGLAVTLFRAAKKEGRIELAATSKTIVTNALRYVRDVDPNSKRIPEMEHFDAEVDSN